MRVTAEAIPGLESESVISPAIIPLPPQSAQACPNSPNRFAAHGPGRAQRLPRKRLTGNRLPTSNVGSGRCHSVGDWAKEAWTANPNRLHFGVYSAYVLMIRISVVICEIQG